MQRAYSENFHKRCPTYIGCSVDPRWHSFMDFRSWMMTQDWKNMSLDKDILIKDNKIYGPDTCAFVTQETNMFLVDRGAARGNLPIGVTWHSRQNKYVAQIGGFGDNKPRTLGYFNTPEAAHTRWYEEKKKQAIILASNQKDQRVANAILERFP